MISRQGSASGHARRRSTTLLVLHLILAIALAQYFLSCAGLPKPETPKPPEPLVLPEPVVELPWIHAYPARWYGNSQAACSITFDDGTLDQYLLAAPELDARGVKGTFFIITGPREEGIWKDGDRYRQLFSWDQARDLQARGHEIASHSATHVDLRAHPHLAETEIREAYDSLRQELSMANPFSFGWPYWRSSPAANEQARRFHHAARAGGIQGSSGSPGLGGASGQALDDYMMIGSRAILSTDTLTKMAPVVDEVHTNGGWFVPSFHGINDGRIPSIALGWEALRLENFQDLLDGLLAYDFWFAPFGTVAKYAMQRDELDLEILRDGTLLWIRYSGRLDPTVFNHSLTLIIELPFTYRLEAIIDDGSGRLLNFFLDKPALVRRYLVELPAGSGTLRIQAHRDSL